MLSFSGDKETVLARAGAGLVMTTHAIARTSSAVFSKSEPISVSGAESGEERETGNMIPAKVGNVELIRG